MKLVAAGGLIAMACACGRSSGTTAHDAAPSSPAGDAGLTAREPAPATTTSATPPRLAWHGKYASTAATLYIPSDWKGVHWKVDDDGAGVGQGDLDFVVDSGGRLHGTLSGPLGPATLDGLVTDRRLTATLSPSDRERGYAGTLQGSMADSTGEGTISASPGLAGAVRLAKFSLNAAGANDPGP
ncbi:MAG TPA: hypothetical protein VKU41_17865 [Polyangiaceae bacterium]|nr:hypothetical protein [Polyangiaceae bacterium]